MSRNLILLFCLISQGYAGTLNRGDSNQLHVQENSIYYVNELHGYMVEVDSKGACQYYGSRSNIKEILQRQESKSLKYIDAEEMKNLIDECRSKSKMEQSSEMRGSFLEGSLIFPGTKWCGDGNIAESYEDLGVYVKTDMCCREHDHCPDYMLSGETKHGLTNDGSFTRSHCDCDDALRQCFQDADESISDTVGYTFFNILGTVCFKEDFPIVSCLEYGGLTGSTCQKYELDETKPMTWQFFDGKDYEC